MLERALAPFVHVALDRLVEEQQRVVVDAQRARAQVEVADRAESGEAEAQSMMGIYYAEGFGVEQDYDQSFKWLSMAAEQGEPNAQNSLGALYKHGYGVEVDDEQAVHWYRSSALQGHAFGQKNLGTMYFRGRGVAQDSEQAYMWLSLAANQGLAQAFDELEKVSATLPDDTKAALDKRARTTPLFLIEQP